MKLSISNIAWSADQDTQVYDLMKVYGFSGLEIAPTRIFPEAPYDKNADAYVWSRNLKEDYGFDIPSMQSIWFGRQEKIFGTDEERQVLLNYTKRAIEFAEAIGCKNLVFGCPKNRNLPDGTERADIDLQFFKELGDYAEAHHTVIGMEANPTIYNTNYINDTKSAIELIKKVDSRGFMLNLDVGTMIQNQEDAGELIGNVGLINHVHISEPFLKPIEERRLHQDLFRILIAERYSGFVSIEIGKVDDKSVIENCVRYVRGIFA